jgi:tetratricopeptide (TPR) repeat protein
MTVEKRSALLSDLLNLRAIVEQQFGAEDIKLIHVLRPLSDLYVSYGQHKEALPLLWDIYRLSQRFPSHVALPRVDQARKVLASTLQSLNCNHQAIDLLQTSLTEEFDESIAASLIDSYLAVHRYDAAIQLTESVLIRIATVQGETAFGLKLTWLARLSRCYAKQGDYATAAKVIERTLPLYEGKPEVVVIPQLEHLADLYRQAGDTENYDRIRARRRFLAEKHDY